MTDEKKQLTRPEATDVRMEGLERTRTRAVFAPEVDIKETKDELVVYADIPGASEGSIDVTVEKGVLTIRAATPEKAPGGNLSSILEEFATGDYERAFALSDEVDPDKIRASVKNGVLTIHVPKATAVKSRRIQVAAE